MQHPHITMCLQVLIAICYIYFTDTKENFFNNLISSQLLRPQTKSVQKKNGFIETMNFMSILSVY